MAIPFRQFDVGRKIFRRRISEHDFASSDHIREQESGEHFTDGANFENCVTVQRSRVSLLEVSVCDHPPSLRPDYADHDADAIFRSGKSVDPS
jgi:hypothetical protein